MTAAFRFAYDYIPFDPQAWGGGISEGNEHFEITYFPATGCDIILAFSGGIAGMRAARDTNMSIIVKPLELSARIVPFEAGDGFACNLIHVRGEQSPTRGPVLVIHGAGVRANLFRPPTETTLVDCLVARGYDVWLENWRASIDLLPNTWTLDQAAVFDHPRAVRKVLEQTGASK